MARGFVFRNPKVRELFEFVGGIAIRPRED
jgi:hypothetical protein